jgi:hypothetical protein
MPVKSGGKDSGRDKAGHTLPQVHFLVKILIAISG